MEMTPGAYVEGRPLYHVRMNLSIGKLMKFSISSKYTKKISPQNRGEIFVKLHKLEWCRSFLQ